MEERQATMHIRDCDVLLADVCRLSPISERVSGSTRLPGHHPAVSPQIEDRTQQLPVVKKKRKNAETERRARCSADELGEEQPINQNIQIEWQQCVGSWRADAAYGRITR